MDDSEPEPEIDSAIELEKEGRKLLLTHLKDGSTNLCEVSACSEIADPEKKMFELIRKFHGDLGYVSKEI